MALQSIKTFASAGEATPGSALGPLLGQYQVNITDFVSKFNAQSSIFEKGIPLAIAVIRNPKDRSYKIVIKGPTTLALLDSTSVLSVRGRECLRPEKLYDIIKIKQKLLSELLGQKIGLEEVAKSVLGTLGSTKIGLLYPECLV